MQDRPNQAPDMNSQLSEPVNRNASRPPPTAMKTWRNPVNSGYKSRAAPGMRIERHTQTKESIRRADDPEISAGLDHRGINTEEDTPEAQRCDEITEETALIAVQKIAARYSSSNRTVRQG